MWLVRFINCILLKIKGIEHFHVLSSKVHQLHHTHVLSVLVFLCEVASREELRPVMNHSTPQVKFNYAGH